MLKNILNQTGFSLTELMVAISIIGMAATFSATQFNSAITLVRDAQRQANIRQVQTALNLYYSDYNQYPVSPDNRATVQGWQIIKQSLENSASPYMPKVPVDPLNNDIYNFRYWSDGQTFKIIFETEDPNDDSPVIAWGY